MKRLIGWLVVGVVLAAAGTCAAAENAAPPPPPVKVRRDANFLRIDGRPALLLWAQGLTDADELDLYRQTGLNTLYVRVVDGSPEELEAVSALMSAAEEQGLYIVASLAPSAIRDEAGETLPVDPDDDRYRRAVEEFATRAAEALSAHPRLIAWLVEAVPPNRIAWGDAGFRSFLEEGYPSLAALNRSWGSNLASWDAITAAAARDVDSTFPWGVGRASVDLAAYREQTFARAVSLWATAVRSADPGRPVLASALTDYRSIASVTSDVDGMVLHVYPSLAEADYVTHNVQAVDIARRGNQFAAVQTLDVWAGDPAQVDGWARLALLHGAAGVAFTDWKKIAGSSALQHVIQTLARDYGESASFPQTPLARIAVLYTPVAGGAARNGQGLYGYVDGLTPKEPTGLFDIVRTGTRYGLLDVLTLSALKETDLNRYGAIIAPAAFYLPDDSQVALQNFVLRGGVLVVDRGAGMYQAQGSVYSMPPLLRDLLGLRHADLSSPTLEKVTSTQDTTGQQGSPGESGLNPVNPIERGLESSQALQELASILEDVLAKKQVTTHFGEQFAVGQGPNLRVREFGKGLAVYVPMFLYQEWGANDPAFVKFHQEILKRRADIEVVFPNKLWPNVSVAVYRGWPIGVSAAGTAVSVDAFDAENQAYLIPGGAMRFANPADDDRTELLFPPATLALARPVPIYLRPRAPGAVVAASVTRYDADGIEIALSGAGAQANVKGGVVRISGGVSVPVEIEIKGGLYPVAAGSIHHLTVTVGRRNRPLIDRDIMPSADTGSLVFTVGAQPARIVVEPVPEQE